MRHYSLNAIEELPNIYDYLYTGGKDFHPDRLIVELGLYESIKIDVSNISYNRSVTPRIPGGENVTITGAYVSEDVKALHTFFKFKDSVLLPCPECNKKLAFIPVDSYQRQDIEGDIEESNLSVKPNLGKTSVFDPSVPCYVFGNDSFILCYGNREQIDLIYGKESCINGIISNIREFQRMFKCTLNPEHTIFIDCMIHRAIDVCKKPQEIRDFEGRKKLDPSIQMTREEKKCGR